MRRNTRAFRMLRVLSISAVLRCRIFFGILATGLLSAPSLHAQMLSALIPAEDYGYLDQYSMNTENDFVGDEACVPTSSTNALTLLQNLNPTVFGVGGLTGTTYSDWHNVDNQMIQLMGTKPNSGTSYSRISYGITDYLNSLPTNYTANIGMSGQFSAVDWTVKYPQPNFITSANPTAQFIYTSLQGNDAVLISIDYSSKNGTYANNGGHELLVNGIVWDATTGTGTIYFIDPLDPSASFSSGTDDNTTYDQANYPAMSTTGTITLLGPDSGSPGSLLLEYDQYETTGITVPENSPDDYSRIFATIDNVLALYLIVTPVPEPSHYGLAIFLALAAFIVRRRMSMHTSGYPR